MQLDDTTLENISTFAYQWTDEIYSYDISYNILTTNLENELLYEMKIRTFANIMWVAMWKICVWNVNVQIVPIGDNLSVVLRL